MLKLVSMASAIESGSADSLSKTSIFCSTIVFLEDEILLREATDRSAVRVGHRHEYVHQVDVDPQRGRRFGLALRVSRILLGGILGSRLLRP